MKEIWLIRHGETAWTISGAHTGTTDIRLTERGREQAAAIRQALVGHDFELVLVSPLTRARETCELAGYGDVAIVDPNLAEWNYGDFEGKTTNEIREQIRDWSVWDHGVVQGETIDQVAKRAAAVIQRATMAEGNVALFAHGHLLRILAARWLGLAPREGRLFALGTASICLLSYERDTRVIERWNQQCICGEAL